MAAGAGLDLDGRIPIAVAVTGHRDLFEEDRAVLRDAVRRVLEQLLDRFPHSPLVVLDALAEGADQCAAEAVVELKDDRSRPDRQGRIHLVVPLPFAQQEYLDGFRPDSPAEAARARQRFEALLPRADLVYRVDELEVRGTGRTSTPPDAAEPFRHLAAHLVRSAHVLIALVDPGEPPKDDGGAASVVDWFENGIPAAYNPGASAIDRPDGLFLATIPVRREGSRRPVPRPEIVDFALPGHDKGRANERLDVLNRIDQFNALDRGRHAAAIRRSADSLLPDGSEGRSELQELARIYAGADVFSQRYRWWIRGHLGFLCLAAVGAVLLFEFYAHVHQGEWKLLAGYLLLFALVFALHWFFRKQKVEGRTHTYRALAEALRLQTHWKYAAVNAVVWNHYSRHFRTEVDWVRHATRGTFACVPPLAASDPEARDRRRNRVVSVWLEDQSAFFARRIARLEAWERVARWSWIGLFGAAMLCAALLALQARRDHEVMDHSHVHHYGLVAVVGLLALAAICHELARFANLHVLARRYASQQEVFGHAKRRMASLCSAGGAADPAEAEATLRDLGATVLAENTAWLLMQREVEVLVH